MQCNCNTPKIAINLFCTSPTSHLYGITGDTPVGEQRGLIKYFKVLEFLCSCVYSHLGFLTFFFGNGKHTTHLPQSLLKHLLPLCLLRKGRVQAAQQAELCFCHTVVFHTVLTVLLKIHVAVQLIDGIIVQSQRFLQSLLTVTVGILRDALVVSRSCRSSQARCKVSGFSASSTAA